MRDRIGAERGWPPMRRAEFDQEADRGSLYVGSPETVARKIAATARTLGLSRFDLKYSAGPLSHETPVALHRAVWPGGDPDGPGHARLTAATVYLAGPMVFEPDPAAIFAAMKRVCERHGLTGVSPLDNQIGLQADAPGKALAARIVAADIALMHRCDAGLVCLDGFRRGPEMDPGTAFEIGYMHALGKPLAGWTRDPRDYPERVRDFFATVFGLGLASAPGGGQSGALRDPDGILVHSEGLLQNAMTQIGIERSGGAVHAHPDWLVAFEHGVADLRSRLPDI